MKRQIFLGVLGRVSYFQFYEILVSRYSELFVKVKDNFNRYALLALAVARCKQYLKLGTAILWVEHTVVAVNFFCLLVLVEFSLGLR